MKAVVCFLAGANAANMVAKQIQAGSGSFYLLGPEGPEVGEPRPPLLHARLRVASCRGGLGIGHRD